MLISLRNYSISLFLSLLIISPFINQAVHFSMNFNIYILIGILFCFYLLLSFVFITKIIHNKININILLSLLLLFLLFLLVHIFNLININKFFITFSSFVLGLFLLMDRNILLINKNLILKLIFFFSVIGIIFGIGSLEILQFGFSSSSRMIYNVSPISLSILSGIAIISVIFLQTTSYVKLVLVLVLALIMMISLSKGPFLALFVTILFYLIIARKFKYILLLLVGAIPISYFIIMNRTGSIDNGRLELYNNSVHIILDNLFGYGIGGYKMITGNDYPHNLLIEFTIELGLLFMIYYILLISSIVIFSIRKKQTNNYFILIMIFINTSCLFSFSSIDLLKINIPIIILAYSFNNIQITYNRRI